MIDIHFHCLPGIDDGPNDWDEAVELCRAAAEEGTSTIVATPHVMRGRWQNDSPVVLRSLVHELNDRLEGHPIIVVGCEFFFCRQLLDLTSGGAESPLLRINDGACALVEFPATQVPRDAEGVLHEMVVEGTTPVIAHPERNAILANDFDRLQRMLNIGALTQLTAGSICGDFGRQAMQASFLMIESGLASVVASDAHSIRSRPPALTKARAAVRTRYGEEVANQLFHRGPQDIVAQQRSSEVRGKSHEVVR